MPSFIFYHCDHWKESYSLLQLQFDMFKEIWMLPWPPGDKRVSGKRCCAHRRCVSQGSARPRAGELMGSTAQCNVGRWPEHGIQGLKRE